MNKEEILKQLFDSDKVVKQIEGLGDNSPRIKVRTIDYVSQSNLEDELRELAKKDLAQRKFVQEYAVYLLSYTLEQWGSMKDSSVEEWRNFLYAKPVALLDKVVKEQQDLEKAVRSALDLKNIDEVFFPKEELPAESTPSQQELTQEKEAVSGKQ